MMMTQAKGACIKQVNDVAIKRKDFRKDLRNLITAVNLQMKFVQKTHVTVSVTYFMYECLKRTIILTSH